MITRKVKSQEVVKARMNELKTNALKFAKIKAKIDELQEQYKQLKTILIDEMESLGMKNIEAGNYKLSIVEKVRSKLNTEELVKRLTKEQIAEVATISKTKLKKYMSDKDIQKYEDDVTITNEIRITKKGGK